MKKVILRCGYCPGDILMLTAAVRDLHRCYPGSFLTDVRTFCPELWANNPLLTPLADEDPDAETIDCTYPLINQANTTPYHCLHGFVHFLNRQLKLDITPGAFRGDIHLSEQEKLWYSQVHEVARRDLPFWIVAAGGKYDITVKWWDPARYQAVIDWFRGRIQFVQVGGYGHHHPRLEGLIDFRGKTSLRELVRLVYHSQGVLCPVTSLMHLAAAVPIKPGQPRCRPCVVIAGGREPAHWEAYPGHQFIHTNSALPCCVEGGCWRDRVRPLRDGDHRDRPERRCVDVRNGLPHCLDLITAEEVIKRVELYFKGGALKFLSVAEQASAERAVRTTSKNHYDLQPLNLHSAGTACDGFVRSIPPYPGNFNGRGIVICGGGIRYFTNAWVCISLLRLHGCQLPIEVWYLGRAELDDKMESLLTSLDVMCVDALKIQEKFPARILKGWELKPYAILHSKFREVLLLDADNAPTADPEYLFSAPEFQSEGAVFWPDYARGKNLKAKAVWRSCGLRQPDEPEFETGQILVDKQRCWAALCLTMWFNENSDFYYRYIHGDKETFHLAFRKLSQRYALVPKPVGSLAGTMCQHDFRGRRIFQHRNFDKWDLFLTNRRVRGFRFEEDCRQAVLQLRRLWDGRLGKLPAPAFARTKAHSAPNIQAVMISCHERNRLREQTLHNLSQTDWDHALVHVQIDPGTGEDFQRRQTRCARLALEQGFASGADFVLFLEDDLDFNRHLHHNLLTWPPIHSRLACLASLYNPNIRELACDVPNRSRLVAPTCVFGSQALLISNKAVAHILRHWNSIRGMQDIRISRLAGRLQTVVFYHAPSLVQHLGKKSLWGGTYHLAKDFDPEWKACSSK